MILIFGGTTEGKQAIHLMNKLEEPYYYSTKTEVEYVKDSFGTYRSGALDEKALFDYIQAYQITKIINAAHPFATLLHQTISKVSEALQIPVFRLERTYEKRQDSESIYYVNDYKACLELLAQKFKGKQLLALSGVQSIPKLETHWKRYKTFFRILDRPSSLEFALNHEFPKEQLILAYPNKEIELEKAIYEQYQVGVVLTKESGGSGYLATKIKAAQCLKIPIIIIKKPKTPNYFKQVNNLMELQHQLYQ